MPEGQEEVVVDASLIVDFVLGGSARSAIGDRLMEVSLHAPAHLDAEVLSAIGRIHRSGSLSARQAGARLEDALGVPVERHELPALIRGAWSRRQRLRLADALYVELAHRLSVPLLTTDAALGRATAIAEVVGR
jgi:predicted nucleic acid-binding protein